MTVTNPETFKLTGGQVDSEGTGASARIVSAITDLGYTGTLTAASGGTPAFITITLPSATWDTHNFEDLVQFAKTINCRLRYTKAS